MTIIFCSCWIVYISLSFPQCCCFSHIPIHCITIRIKSNSLTRHIYMCCFRVFACAYVSVYMLLYERASPFTYSISLFSIYSVVVFSIYFIFISLRGKMQFVEFQRFFIVLLMITILITYMYVWMYKSCRFWVCNVCVCVCNLHVMPQTAACTWYFLHFSSLVTIYWGFNFKRVYCDIFCHVEQYICTTNAWFMRLSLRELSVF